MSDSIQKRAKSTAAMTISVLLGPLIMFGLFCVATSFVVNPSLRTKRLQHDSLAPFMIPTARTRTSSTTRVMMAGFGAKPKETPPATGAGRGQRVYERQVRSYKGLRAAGAEGIDVYVHRVGGDDKFIFAGKVAWSSEVSAEQAIQWQRDLILDHVKVLEPLWNTKPSPQMRIFTAPLNTEVEVAKNVLDLTRALVGKGKGQGKAAVSTDGMTSEQVGFSPEMYEKGQDYYYVRKLEDGRCPAPPAEVKIETMDTLKAARVVADEGLTTTAE